MTIKIKCAWCGAWMGLKPSNTDHGGSELVSHSICHACKKKVLDDAEEFLNRTTNNIEKEIERRR
jgi:hypothetical protein